MGEPVCTVDGTLDAFSSLSQGSTADEIQDDKGATHKQSTSSSSGLAGGEPNEGKDNRTPGPKQDISDTELRQNSKQAEEGHDDSAQDPNRIIKRSHSAELSGQQADSAQCQRSRRCSAP